MEPKIPRRFWPIRELEVNLLAHFLAAVLSVQTNSMRLVGTPLGIVQQRAQPAWSEYE